jgi:predicted ThiF/HesA family dinucleotide-utilizing enzyme
MPKVGVGRIFRLAAGQAGSSRDHERKNVKRKRGARIGEKYIEFVKKLEAPYVKPQ